jgi:acetyltransferase-like isoleucine patch superfamily enzyme
MFTQILLMILPWPLRRRALRLFFGFRFAPKAYVGFSVLLIDHLRLGERARIGHLNFVRGLREIELGDYAEIGNLNWITGMPSSNKSFFEADVGRDPSLHLERHSALTHRHLIDCTDRIRIGEFSVFAGWRSQILTHSIDIRECRQRAQPVTVGKYCFVGTGCILLPGAALPDRCILGAGSVLAHRMDEEGKIYSGTPAVAVRDTDSNAGYFKRSVGWVY